MVQRITKGQGKAARPLTAPTLLTQANRSGERDQLRTAPKQTAKPQRLDAPYGCWECGVVLDDRTRQYCDECLPEYREAQANVSVDAGRVKLKELRAEGTNPSPTVEAGEKRRSTMQQRRREEGESDAAHPNTVVDDSVFTTEILPTLQELSLSAIAGATGLFQQYCSLIRRGLNVPHPRHWEAMSRLQENVRLGSGDSRSGGKVQ